MRDLPADGYTCPCGVFHRFSAWVHAHWRESITHECEKCGKTNRLRAGKLLKRRVK